MIFMGILTKKRTELLKFLECNFKKVEISVDPLGKIPKSRKSSKNT